MRWDEVRGDKSRMLTYQDFVEAGDAGREGFVLEAIERHKSGHAYRTARMADAYDRQENTTINAYVQKVFDITGSKLVDFTAGNNKIASNFFHRLNTQRTMYSLGQGVSFVDADEAGGEDKTKERLGRHFDHDLRTLAYDALIHGVCFGFWNLDRLFVFPLTEFVPLWDEYDGTLRAGIRFWRIDQSRPMHAVLYEADGYTGYRSRRDAGGPRTGASRRSRRSGPTSRRRATRPQTASSGWSAARTTRRCRWCRCGARGSTSRRSSACARRSTATT